MSDKQTPIQASLDPEESLESIGPARTDGEPERQAKRSAAGVISDIKGNKPALLIIGLVVLAVGGAVLTKRNQQQAAVKSDTVIQVPVGEVATERSSDDPRVAGLDKKADEAAAQKAAEVGASYIPPLAPLAPLAEPAAAPKAAEQAPPASQMPTVSSNGASRKNDKRQESLEKAMQKQLAMIDKRVMGTGRKLDTTPVRLDAEEFSSYGGVNYQTSSQVAAGEAATGGGRLGYPMGTSWRATLPSGADTDRPGTVKAIIDEGPFAGREALCNFTWPSREYINLECFAIKLDRESLPISMIAVGPDEMPNIKAEYNGRYIQRLGSQFLVALPGAYAEGLAMGGTSVTNGSATTTTEPELSGSDLVIYAAGKATAPLAEEMQEIANDIKPQAKIRPQQAIRLMLAEDI